ncbi:MAG: PAS domain-containing protein [Bacteroidales bacterium]|nr:PAS domain-containing protein [Bacteroidales bacterium]
MAISQFLEFKRVQCKDCFRCLRECPVKAISFADQHAQIIEDRCILCGRCMHVCPQNAKIVHGDFDRVLMMLRSGKKVIASVAPSFVSCLGFKSFAPLRKVFKKMGFFDAEETARGAEWVTREYSKLLEKGEMKNFITSACPSACRLIQEYFPQALPYLAPVVSPMVAHARLIHAEHPDAEVVFFGPCLAKKREASESGEVSAVITFSEMLDDHFAFDIKSMVEQVSLEEDCADVESDNIDYKAKGYPVTEGIIRSFTTLPQGYRYMTVDGYKRCMEVLENIENYEGVFMEINICPNGCVNGPCAVLPQGGTTKAKMELLDYVDNQRELHPQASQPAQSEVDFGWVYPRVTNRSRKVTDKEIEEVLQRTGKMSPADELNCGVCGYRSCRGKAWAVINGYADIEMCLPYMRKKAESLAVAVVHKSPEGIIIVNSDLEIVDANATAMEMLGMGGTPERLTPQPLNDFFSPLDFYLAYTQKRNVEVHKQFIRATQRYVDITICNMEENKLIFGQMKDVTEEVNYEKKLEHLRDETLETTDQVIMKQMRVAQEIASLLGETTAETKVALLNLKKMLQQEK